MVLLPPFEPGTGFPISQGFQGDRTHTTPDSEFAIDIVDAGGHRHTRGP